MGINVNLQRIKRARARKISDHFSTVDLFTDTAEVHTSADETSLFLEGPGHEDAAARIAALINEQIIKRDTNTRDPVFENTVKIAAEDEEQDEQLLDEIAQEDRRQAHNDELGPRAPQFPREHEEAMERLVERDDEVPF